MYRVKIADPARKDVRAAFQWWQANRSAEQAGCWYLGIHDAIASLREMPERCAICPESDLHPDGLRQRLFGLGRRPTHRIVFTISSEVVTVLRVRHVSQDAIEGDDLA